jgi:hypothetical protein
MTNLPATPYEAFADDWIKQYCEPVVGVFHASYSLKNLMRLWALHNPLGADEIVMFAEEYGSQEAAEVLRDLITERLDRNESLGAVLGGYEIRKHNPARKRKSGPGKLDNARRDIGISLLVYALMKEFGLAVHHNPASTRPSCSTVAAASLTRAGLGPIGHRGVAKVWDRLGPLVMPGPIPAGYLGPLA